MTKCSPASIQEFANLCNSLNITPPELFEEEFKSDQQQIDLNNLAKNVRSYLDTHQLALSEFEDRVGWGLGAFLENPIVIVTDRYNIDALKDISKEIGINWVSALTGITSELTKTAF